MSIVWNKAPFKLKKQMFDLFSGDDIMKISQRGEPLKLTEEIEDVQGKLSVENGRPVSMDETITFLLENKDKFELIENVFDVEIERNECVEPEEEEEEGINEEHEIASRFEDVAGNILGMVAEILGVKVEKVEAPKFTLYKHVGTELGAKIYISNEDEFLTLVKEDARIFDPLNPQDEADLNRLDEQGWHADIVE